MQVGERNLLQAEGAQTAKAVFNHCFTGMRSYLFHHSALNKQTNICSWHKLTYFVIGFAYLGINATSKVKECLQELQLDIGK